MVDVYDASSDEQTPFLVMERLEGETLRARIERAPLSWEELLTLLVPAMRGVAELHRQGIVHRDLKPDNVFLARMPGASDPCAKVLDFGVSLLRSAEPHEDSLTGTGAIVGTPSYMALEQLRGAENVDERTDVYALGVVLFEALTGKRPWQARSAGEYGALLASTRPTRLSALKPELKGAREAAIMKALEREPADRYQSVDAFIAALLAASRPRRITPVLWAALAFAVAGVLLLVGFWPSCQRELERRPEAHVVPVRQTPQNARLSAPVPVLVPAPPAVGARAGTEVASAPSAAQGHHLAPAPRVRSTPPMRGPKRALSSPRPVPQPTDPGSDRATRLARDEF